jgi:hypothetical protein
MPLFGAQNINLGLPVHRRRVHYKSGGFQVIQQNLYDPGRSTYRSNIETSIVTTLSTAKVVALNISLFDFSLV